MPCVLSSVSRRMRYAICIPSKGRANTLIKTFKKMPFLETPDTYIGIEEKENDAYQSFFREFGGVAARITYDNPTGSVAVAREAIRRVVTHLSYDYIVVTDDNAHYTKDALNALVDTLHTYRSSLPYIKGSWAIMAGMHSTATHFDRHRIAKTKITIEGFESYQHFAMIFQVYPMDLYKAYSYPADAYGLDDRHLLCWAISQGLTQNRFRVAMNAPFTKSRYQAGGQGTPAERARKCGLAIARLAQDFPDIVGAKGTFPIAWQTAFALLEGKSLDRLAGGAMRKEEALVHTPPLRIRRRI